MMGGLKTQLCRTTCTFLPPARRPSSLLSLQTRWAAALEARTPDNVSKQNRSTREPFATDAQFFKTWAGRRSLEKRDVDSPERNTVRFVDSEASRDRLFSPSRTSNSTRLYGPSESYGEGRSYESSRPHEQTSRRLSSDIARGIDAEGKPNPTEAKKPAPDDIVRVSINVDGLPYEFSTLLLRDMCTCAQCIDGSTKQKLFSTTDIPAKINAAGVSYDSVGYADITWSNDVAGCGDAHVSRFELQALRTLAQTGQLRALVPPLSRRLWNAESYRNEVKDMDYDTYMQDDRSLFTALRTLHTHGLLFLTNVPESKASVSTIAERIGPIKNTFYGSTWDVRAVPQAKNVAYTSQDLGFHMDLLYMEQPPHLQFLHCIRSSSAGGVSLFTDSYKAIVDLFAEDWELLEVLRFTHVNYHYDHLPSHYYHQKRKVVNFRDFLSTTPSHAVDKIVKSAEHLHVPHEDINLGDYIDSVSWAPPFQAPFPSDLPPGPLRDRELTLPWSEQFADNRHNKISEAVKKWHTAATKFSALIHRPEAIYERMMGPGECVIFDNRRVLHARKAFEVEEGRERWLRGAYLDKEPYTSRLESLRHRFDSSRSQRETPRTAVETDNAPRASTAPIT